MPIYRASADRGMWLDSHVSLQPKGTVRETLNARSVVAPQSTPYMTNDLGVTKVADLGTEKVVGYHRVEERDQTIFFVDDGSSTIKLFDHKTGEVTKIVSDSDYGCDWEFSKAKWIGHGHSTSKPIAPCNDLILYWSSGYTYYWANIDVLLDGKRKDQKECDDFLLFPPTPGARVNVSRLLEGGQDLAPGPYYAAARFYDEDGNRTNWSFIEGPAYLGSKSNDPADGNPSNESLRIEVNSPGEQYSGIDIAVIPPAGEGPGADGYIVYTGSFNTNGVSVQYYSSEQNREVISLSSILTRKNVHVKGASLLQTDGRLDLNRVLQRKNLNYQKYANQIKVKYAVYAVPINQADSFSALQRDEVYALGIQYKYIDGTYSYNFHIPGPGGGDNWLSADCPLPAGQTGNNSSRTATYITYDGSTPNYKTKPGDRRTIREGNSTSSSVGVSSDEVGITAIGDPCTSNQECLDSSGPCSECVGGFCAQKTCPPGESCDPITGECIASGGGGGGGGGGSNSDLASAYQGFGTLDGITFENMATELKGLETKPEDFPEDCYDCDVSKQVGDMSKNKNVFLRFWENLTDLSKTREEALNDPSQNKTSTFQGGVSLFYDSVVREAYLDEEIDKYTNIESSGGSNLEASGSSPNTLGILAVDSSEESCDPRPRAELVAIGTPAGWESEDIYPDTEDCEGNPIYEDLAGEPIRHHKMPTMAQEPLFATSQAGVESRFDPSNVPDGDTIVFMIGLDISNITLPTEDDLPLPLDPNEPFKINYVERSLHNSSVLGYGYITNTFEGKLGGKTYAVPCHAVNSKETVDKHIDNNKSHLGAQWSESLYNFHSPDTNVEAGILGADYISLTGEMHGTGRRYHLYAEEEEPKISTEQRKDRLGARSAVNLNDFKPKDTAIGLKGAQRARFNSKFQPDSSISKPLLNMSKEGSVYIETDEPLPELEGGNYDNSFVGDGLDHECVIKNARCWTGTLKRLNTRQYGGVAALRYANLGLKANPLREGQTTATVRGLVGDVFVGKWSHRRPAFISDKVGRWLNSEIPEAGSNNYLGIPLWPRPGYSAGTLKSVCDTPNRRGWDLKEWLGFWNPHTLPATGDKRDPKNMCNLRPTKTCDEAAEGTSSPTFDIYYWRTLNHLNHFIMESKINLAHRVVGIRDIGETYYEVLDRHELDVDSTVYGSSLKDGWLNDFHSERIQPSERQRSIKASIRTILCLIIPGILIDQAGADFDLYDVNTVMMAMPMFILWQYLVTKLLTPAGIDKLIGAPLCGPDDIEEDGTYSAPNTDPTPIRGQKKNFLQYSWAFSAPNLLNNFLGMGHPYNTCDCSDELEKNVQNRIHSSNQQIQTSQVDAFRNFQANSYTGLTAEKGLIQKMFLWGNRVFVNTTDAMYAIQERGQGSANTEERALLGQARYIDNPSAIIDGAFAGYAGTIDPNAMITIPEGIITVDGEANKLYLFTGSQFEELSSPKYGMSQWFDKNLRLSDTSETRDELVNGGVHYAFGHDVQEDRLMISKNDGAESWTISFDLGLRMFRSFHTYVPQFYFWDRNQMYSVDKGGIYKHNSGGKVSPFYTTVVLSGAGSQQARVPFAFHSGLLDTEINVGDLLDTIASFTSVRFWNERQSTGKLNIVFPDRLDRSNDISPIGDQLPLDRSLKGTWAFNDLRNYAKDVNLPPMFIPKKGYELVFNDANIDINQDWTKINILRGKYIQVRLEYTGQDEINFFSLSSLVENTMETANVKISK